ncbi:D-alanine-D-alanine ligase-like ATP-grasp enzyme [Bradyrhizobium sp. USDA 3240]
MRKLRIGESITTIGSMDSGLSLREPRNDRSSERQAKNMQVTILFGGTNKERLVSVASAQALHRALPDADLWFWDVDDTVHAVTSEQLLGHTRPFEVDFKPGGPGLALDQALDRAGAEQRVLVLGLHGGRAENGELQAMCEMRGVAFTGSGSASSHLAFDKPSAKRFAAITGLNAPLGITVAQLDDAFAQHGRLIAKPAKDGSSYGLIFVNAKQDLVAVRNAAKHEDYLIEPFVSGVEATCGVLEQSDGTVFALPPIEIVPAEGGLRLHSQIPPEVDPGDLPRPFRPRDQRRDHGPCAAGAPRIVLHRLFAQRFHRVGQWPGLPRDQHAARPHRGIAVP